ncbi:MAG: hypothetical protein ABWY02_14110, partial [Telluria sp.]
MAAKRIRIKLTESKTEASSAASVVTANQDTRGNAAAGAYAELFSPRNYVVAARTFDVGSGRFAPELLLGRRALEALTSAAYAQATGNITLKPSEIDTIVGDADILTRFYTAPGPGNGRGCAH